MARLSGVQKAIGIRNDMAVLHSNLAYAYFGDKKYEQASLLSARRWHWIRNCSSKQFEKRIAFCRTGPL